MKILKINNCAICPNKIWAGNARICVAYGYKKIDAPVTDIPDWCPLEDAPIKVAIFEVGKYHDTPDTTRVFSSVEKAVGNIPAEFKKIEYPGYHYADEINKKWLSIKEYEVEG